MSEEMGEYVKGTMGEYVKGTCEVKPLTINIDTAEANQAIEKLKKNIENCHEALKALKAELPMGSVDFKIDPAAIIATVSGYLKKIKFKEDKKA